MHGERALHAAANGAGARTTVAAGLLSALLAATLCVVASEPGLAAKTESHIDPLPGGGRYRLYVLGDSLAANLGDGLVWALRDVKDVQVIKHTKAGTGFVREDVLDWTQSVADLLHDKKVDIAVIAIGGNDRQDIRHGRKRYLRFTAPWREEYRRRVDRFMRTLASRHVALYWVALPPVRSGQMSRDYKGLNVIYRELAGRHGIKLIDTSGKLGGPSGGYSPYGTGPDGRTVRLRDGDGIHFTLEGSRLLGGLVAEVIHRDLRAARSLLSASPDDN